jgi:hypothetical protein
MKTNLRRWVLAVLAIGLIGLFAVLTGCASSGGYEGEVGVYGVDYYEPYGYSYGHWHPRYHVAPPRGGQERRDRPASAQTAPAQTAPAQTAPVQTAPVQSRPSTPAYRPAPPSRPAPSIPTKPRSRSH